MFKFLENAEILKEKKKQRKIEYRKDLQLQIEQKRLKIIEEKKQLIKENLNNNELTQDLGIGKNYFFGKKDKKMNELEHLKISIDNSLMKYKIKSKFPNFSKNNSFNKKDFTNIINPTEYKYNENKIKNNNFDNKNEHFMKKSLSQMLKSISIKNNIIANSNINFDKKILMKEIDIQSLFKGFVEQQIRTINDYATNLENIFYLQYTKKDDNIFLFNYLIKNEKNKAMKSIKNEKNKLKSKFGFFPMENIYDSRIEQLFNKILNKIISIYSSLNQIQINNYVNNDNSTINLFPFKSKLHLNNKVYENPDIYNIESDFLLDKNGYSNVINTKGTELMNNKINLDDDLDFFDYWKNKFEKDIMKEKNKIFNVNETVELKNSTKNINNCQNNLNIFPANNFCKKVKFREINKINKIKNKNNNGIKLPKINIKENIIKKRNWSANNKIPEKIFSFN